MAVTQPVRIAAVYRFATVADPLALREALAALCADLELRGTLLVAPEGINGTIAGGDAAVEALLAHVRALPGFADLAVRESRAAGMPFDRMKVRLKREIVTLGQPQVNAAQDTGTHVDPADWNAVIAAPDTLLIDTRNAYEVALGSFPGALDPQTRSFRDFPERFRALAAERGMPRRVAMFCTGGIRCEKASAFLKAEGVAEVYQLKGGILGYLEAVAPQDSLWQGECFVFDRRVTVTEALQPGQRTLCPSCQRSAGLCDCASTDEPAS